MRAYLKGYYWYQNLGDEILLFGVLQYCYEKLAITDCVIECDDKLLRMQDRIEKHQELIPQGLSYTLVPRPKRRQQLKNMIQSACGLFPLLILGGGEVINTIHAFPHNGRNYIIQYRGNILRWNYIILGGVTLRNKKDLIGNFLIKNAKVLVLRDETSRSAAHHINPKAIHYQDFAIQVIRHYQKSIDPKTKADYMLINLHPSKINSETIGRIQACIDEHRGADLWFVSCDIRHDVTCYHQLKAHIPRLQYYDWTQQDILCIMRFFSAAKAGIGARLHFLLPLQLLWVPFQALVYHDKVKKVLQLGKDV